MPAKRAMASRLGGVPGVAEGGAGHAREAGDGQRSPLRSSPARSPPTIVARQLQRFVGWWTRDARIETEREGASDSERAGRGARDEAKNGVRWKRGDRAVASGCERTGS